MNGPEPSDSSKPPAPPAYGTRDWFDREYAMVEGDPWGLNWRPSQRIRLQAMLALLAPYFHAPARILDVGCARGDFTQLLADAAAPGSVVVGADMAAAAVARAAAAHPSIPFRRASIMEIGALDLGPIDVITCLEVMYYLPPAERVDALRALEGVLADNGVVLFSSLVSRAPYFSRSALRALVAARFDVIAEGDVHVRLLARAEKLAMLLARLTTSDARRAAARAERVFGLIPRALANSLSRVWKRRPSHCYVLARKRG